MQWTQLCVHGTLSDRDTICAILCMLDENIVLEDYSDIDMKTVYADLIDEKILHADKNNITASIYVSEDKPLGEYISFLKDRFRIAHIDAQITCNGIKEEEWATAWRKYYHPTPIGNRLVIVPGWQTYTPKNTEITVQMDPGMAFGTGTHETTRLCGALLEQYVTPGDTQLDVGTGSGILAICGIKLGASYALACDIDPVAVRVAKENAEKNGVADQIDCVCADLLQGITPPARRLSDLYGEYRPRTSYYLSPLPSAHFLRQTESLFPPALLTPARREGRYLRSNNMAIPFSPSNGTAVGALSAHKKQTTHLAAMRIVNKDANHKTHARTVCTHF